MELYYIDEEKLIKVYGNFGKVCSTKNHRILEYTIKRIYNILVLLNNLICVIEVYNYGKK